MDKVEFIEQTKVFSKRELKIPLSILFFILKNKFPEELKNASSTFVEYSFNNDLNSEEFLSCSWEENQVEDRSVEVKPFKLSSEKLTEMARLASLEDL